MFGRHTNDALSVTDNKSCASSRVSGSSTKPNSADESEDDFGMTAGSGGDENHKMFLMIRMLEKYLKITDTEDTIYDEEDDNEERKDDIFKLTDSTKGESWMQNTEMTTSPTFSVLSDDDMRFSRGSSAAEDNECYSGGTTSMSPVSDATGRSRTFRYPLSSDNSSTTSPQQRHPPTSFLDSVGRGISPKSSNTHTSLLLESLRYFSRTSRNPLLSSTNFTPNVLQDKHLLRRIRDELKQQQLDRIFRRHGPNSNLRITSSMVTLPFSSSSPFSSSFDLWATKPSNVTTNTSSTSNVGASTSRPAPVNYSSSRTATITSSEALPHQSHGTAHNQLPIIDVKCASFDRATSVCDSGTQTDPIPINFIYKIHEDFMKRLEKTDDKNEDASVSAQNTDKNVVGKSQDNNSKHSRRKSSIDNEDVSQSVSDTIKRYLRMARKKPSNKDDANRFKRINYDTNLRNIKPKAEIPHPDEIEFPSNNKNVQTNDDWISLVMAEVNLYTASQSTTASPAPSRRNKLMLSLGSLKKPRSTSSSPYHSSPPSPSPGSISQTIPNQKNSNIFQVCNSR